MEWTDPLDHRIVQEFEALLLKQRVRLRESVRARRPPSIRPEPRPSSDTVCVAPPERERPYLPICEICGEPVARVPDLTHGRRRYHPGACEQAARRARNPRKPGPVRLAWVEPGL